MRLGIVTWFEYENYGTKLQAYALQSYLRNMGHDAELVNFIIEDKSSSSLHPKVSLRRRISNHVSYELKKTAERRFASFLMEKSQKMNSFIAENCHLSRPIHSNKEYIEICNQYDALLFGSDQIWNPNWIHPYYYADFEEITTPRIAYAPSLGIANVPDTVSSDMRKKLNRFQSLSVREAQGGDEIYKLTGRQPQLVVDPTLLLDSNDWLNLAERSDASLPKSRYVLCYFLSDNSNHWAAVKHYAKENGVELLIIPQTGFAYWQKNAMIEKTAGVEDFVTLIKNAECVFTDSFHACVFSLLFQKKFAVFERFAKTDPSAQNTRIYNLLNLAGENARLLPYGAKSIKNESLDAPNPSNRLFDLIDQSKQYLNDSLEQIGK